MRALLLSCIVLCAVQPVAAQPAQLLEAVGRQPAVVERVLRHWVLVGMEPQTARPRTDLLLETERFQADLDALLGAELAVPVRQRAAALESAWWELRPLLDREPALADVPALTERAAAVQAAADGVARALLVEHPDTVAPLVEQAGRQRTLSQRLVRLYLLRAWGAGDDASAPAMGAAIESFEAGMARLRAAPETGRVVDDLLDVAAQHWVWLKSAVNIHRDGVYFPDIVIDAGDRLLAVLDHVVARYARLR